MQRTGVVVSFVIAVGLVAAAVACSAGDDGAASPGPADVDAEQAPAAAGARQEFEDSIVFTSPSFNEKKRIPKKHTCTKISANEPNISPPIAWGQCPGRRRHLRAHHGQPGGRQGRGARSLGDVEHPGGYEGAHRGSRALRPPWRMEPYRAPTTAERSAISGRARPSSSSVRRATYPPASSRSSRSSSTPSACTPSTRRSTCRPVPPGQSCWPRWKATYWPAASSSESVRGRPPSKRRSSESNRHHGTAGAGPTGSSACFASLRSTQNPPPPSFPRRACPRVGELPFVVNAASREGSLRGAAAERNVPVIVYEAGEALRFDEAAIRAGVRGRGPGNAKPRHVVRQKTRQWFERSHDSALE